FGDPSWRPIDDPDALVSECASLVAARASGGWDTHVTLPPAQWTPRIRDLHPARATIDPDSCILLFYNQFQNLAWGYAVYPLAGAAIPAPCDRPGGPCPDGWVWPPADPRIVRWQAADG